MSSEPLFLLMAAILLGFLVLASLAISILKNTLQNKKILQEWQKKQEAYLIDIDAQLADLQCTLKNLTCSPTLSEQNAPKLGEDGGIPYPTGRFSAQKGEALPDLRPFAQQEQAPRLDLFLGS